jgi:hypothetical protein
MVPTTKHQEKRVNFKNPIVASSLIISIREISGQGEAIMWPDGRQRLRLLGNKWRGLPLLIGAPIE